MQFSDFQVPPKSRFTKNFKISRIWDFDVDQVELKCLFSKIVPTIQTRTPISQLRKYIAGQSFSL